MPKLKAEIHGNLDAIACFSNRHRIDSRVSRCRVRAGVSRRRITPAVQRSRPPSAGTIEHSGPIPTVFLVFSTTASCGGDSGSSRSTAKIAYV